MLCRGGALGQQVVLPARVARLRPERGEKLGERERENRGRRKRAAARFAFATAARSASAARVHVGGACMP